MTRITTLFRSAILTVKRFDHPQDQVHVDGQIDEPNDYGVSFLISGAFTVERGRRAWNFSPGDILLCAPGVKGAVFHPQGRATDECLSIRFGREQLYELLGTLPDIEACPHRSASARSAFHMWQLSTILRSAEPLLMEGVALSSAQAFLPSGNNILTLPSIDRNLSWYRRRVHRVCELVEQDCSAALRLSDLSQVAGISPFHFNRVFHYLVGMPLHRYIVHMRLGEAARAIRKGNSIASSAYDVGFSSVSYFSGVFAGSLA